MKAKGGYLHVLASVLAALGLLVAGCDDGDDGGGGPGLAGTWVLTSVTLEQNVFNPADIGWDITLVLNADGTFSISQVVWWEDPISDAGTWSTSGGNLTMETGEETDVFAYTLSGDTLTLDLGSDPDGDYDDFPAVLTLERR